MMHRTLVPIFVTCLTAAAVTSAAPQTGTPVEVDAVKPKKEKIPSLHFLKENRDFFRGRMDAVRQTPHDVDNDVVSVDERFLAYDKMLADIVAARDTLAGERVTEADRKFLASVTEFGELESHLDLLQQLLGEQETRLRELQEDFLGRQTTALVIVVRGLPEDPPDAVHITDGYGEQLHVDLSPEQKTSLSQGGILQVFHNFVEPRAQTWAFTFTGGKWSTDEKAFLSFEPTRNKITFLELDLAEAKPRDVAASIRTSAWVHDPPQHDTSANAR